MGSRALNKWTLIREIDEEITTKAGFVMTGNEASVRYAVGEVTSPGGAADQNIKKGDRVYFDTARSHQLFLNEEYITVVRSEDLVIVDE